MNIILYNNYAENNKIDKSDYLSNSLEIEGTLRDECNVINPSITLELNNSTLNYYVLANDDIVYGNDSKIVYKYNTPVFSFNYLYIPDFNRYYFITNITSVRTNLWRLDLKCDVLMSYKDIILNWKLYVSRNEFTFDEYIEDTLLPLKYNKENDIFVPEDLDISKYNDLQLIKFNDVKYIITTITSVLNQETDGTYDLVSPNKYLKGILPSYRFGQVSGSVFNCAQLINDNSKINLLADKIIKDDGLASKIISLIAFPFNNFSSWESIGSLYIGDSSFEDIEVTANENSSVRYLVNKVFKIESKFKNFLDYEPYTTYEIYIPFLGLTPFKAQDILDKELWLVYYVSPSDTNGYVMLINKTDNRYVWGNQVQVGLNIGINSTTAREYKNANFGNALQTAGGVAGSLLGLGISSLTSNPIGLAINAAGLAGSITSGISKMTQNMEYGKTATNTGLTGSIAPTEVYVKATRPIVAVDNEKLYAKYIGKPLQENVVLKTLKGFTIVGGVHIENIPNATNNEKSEIESLLRGGVIC